MIIQDLIEAYGLSEFMDDYSEQLVETGSTTITVADKEYVLNVFVSEE